MHGLHQSRTGDERAHDDERERDAGAHDAPALERAALAVHGEAVDERHAHQPRQQAGVFHGVPAPIAAPAEHHVGPHGAKADADAQEQPGEQGVTLAAHHPFLGRVVHDERGDGIGERDGQARITHEQGWRMDGHGPMLEQGIHAQHACRIGQRAVGVVVLLRRDRERHVALAEQQHAHERRQHQLRHHKGHGIQLARAFQVADGHHGVEHADKPRPEQQRALAAGPQAGQLEQPAKRAFSVAMLLEHVLDGVVAREEAVHQDAAAYGKRHRGQDGGDMPAPCQGLAKRAFPLAPQDRARQQAQHRYGHAGERHQQAHKADSRHT